MSLPKISVPTHTVELPTNKKKYKFRPFLVKEQKLLLIALESKDHEQMKQAMRDIISACFFEKIDVNRLASFEIEYLFMKLRAKSAGEVAEMAFRCENIVKKPVIGEDLQPTGEEKEDECGGVIEIAVNLDTVELDMTKVKPSKIVIGKGETGEVGIVMQFPTYEISEKYMGMTEATVESSMHMIADCVEAVYEGEQVYAGKDIDHAELVSFIDQIPTDKFQEIMEFLASAPRLSKELDLTCPKCKNHTKYTVEGLESFFG